MRSPVSEPAVAVRRSTSRHSPFLIVAACVLATSIGAMLPAVAFAATGDLVGTANFSQQCGGFQGVGVGVTFDGTNLWYSCAESTPDLFRADPHTGEVTASYTIGGGIGALAYDATHNVIYAGWGNSSNQGKIYAIQLGANRSVTASVVKFVAPGAIVCGLDDGLAYDGSNDTLYVSDDCSTTIHHYAASGNELDSFAWAGSGCYNSGLALGDQLIFQGADGCSTVYVVDKSAPQTVKYQFSTAVPGDPNFRDEGLSCDTSSFPGKDVMWSKEAYAPERAHAFEVPAGSCGVGGLPAAPVRIAVVGDSYASGEGTYSTDSSHLPIDYYGGEEGGSSYPQTVVGGFNGDSASASDHCHRSPFAAGPLLGAAEPDFVACSGANINQVASGSNGEVSQLNILHPGDSEVLVSASGDNLEFPSVLAQCIDIRLFGLGRRATDQGCKGKIDEELKKLPKVMGELHTKLLNPIIERTHGASVVLIGYPHLFPPGGTDGGCNGITAQRQRYLNDATDQLDGALKTLASAYVGPGRVQFADTRPTFAGHAVCGDSHPYINDLQFRDIAFANNCPADYATAAHGPDSLVCTQSFHPNSWGYIAEALMLSKMITLPSNAPLFAVVRVLCDGPFQSDYCAGLHR